jgi:lipoprotein signal peptidase
MNGDNSFQRHHLTRPAFRSSAAWMIMLVVFVGALALDLGTKTWAFKSVNITRQDLINNPHWTSPVPPKPLLPWRLLDKRQVFNHGAVFGIGSNQRFFFIAFTTAALTAGLFIFGRFTRANHRLAHIAIGLVLAGGMGNLYDRVTLGAVRDFLHVLPNRPLPFQWRWPGGSPEMFPWVFNVADMALLLGMTLLLLHMNRVERRRATTGASGANASPQAVATADTN